MSAALSPAACALFLVSAFVLAGFCQAAWLSSPASWRFAVPIDGGRMLGGQRLLGGNKTWRGFVVMVPAAAASFALLAFLSRESPWRVAGLWPLTVGEYAGLGLLAGLGFMAGELPNSLVKRRLGIAPGRAATGPVARPVFFLIDRIDSAAGMMLALSLAVPVPPATWLWVFAIGPVLHGLFSVLVFQLGGKARAA
jgi:hypothetical protein